MYKRQGERVVDITPHQRHEAFEGMSVRGLRGRTRAFIKIQDGCERYCSYCIIPTARGPIRSKPLTDIRAELEGLVENGYKEVVLVGINLSSYGKDLGLRLIDAVKLACSVEGLHRVRLGSLEPELLSDEDLSEMAKLCLLYTSVFTPGFVNIACNTPHKTVKRLIVSKIRRRFVNL